MEAELLSVGTELLIGQVVDTNAAYLGQQLAAIGIDVTLKTTVGDDLERVSWAMSEALGRCPLVVSTGGLGPTHDDLTAAAAARATGRELEFDPRSFERIRAFFERLNRSHAATDEQRKQAMIPRGAAVIDNPIGTAPGFIVESSDSALFVLPGIPAEMRAMTETALLPRLRQSCPERGAVRRRTLRFTGVGESSLAARLKPVREHSPEAEIAFLPDPGEVRVRVTARAATAEGAESALAGAEREIVRLAGDWLTSTEDEPLEVVVGRLLRERGATLAIAESCTGGLIGDRVTEVPSSSDYFLLDVVAYSNHAKTELLEVSESTLAAHGAVSAQAAMQMACGALSRAGATYGLGTTGIAGPGGGSEGKPVGLVYIALAGPDGEVAEEHRMPGDRQAVKMRTAQAALDLLRRRLLTGDN